jgi:hypothetical protein
MNPNMFIQEIEIEIKKINTQIDDINAQLEPINVLFRKPFATWNDFEKEIYPSRAELSEDRNKLRYKERHLMDEKSQLRYEKRHLMDKESQLRDSLRAQGMSYFPRRFKKLAAVVPMDVDVPTPVKVVPPIFDKVVYSSKNLPLFPFFDAEVEKYLKFHGKGVLLARDGAINQINTIIKNRNIAKYQPIICSTSRGMGKTSFMEAIAMQLVKPELENELMSEALLCGRILSFDFDYSPLAAYALATEKDVLTFFTRLMIYYLCRIFDGTQVDGIFFTAVLFREMGDPAAGLAKEDQPIFAEWKLKCMHQETDWMIDEYIRLTNIAFNVDSKMPPVFLLDEVQILCKPSNVLTSPAQNEIVYHSFLSLLLNQLSGLHRPVCICAGTNSGNIIDIGEKSKVLPELVSLTALFKEEDYHTFWRQRTHFLTNSNPEKNLRLTKITVEDSDMILSLVYASYQIPRLLQMAHHAWFDYRTESNLKDLIQPLQRFEDKAITYYAEMMNLLFNQQYTVNDLVHIFFCCGVHWKVKNIHSFVPGTKILWNDLIKLSLIFPYMEGCYLIPFGLLWAAKTPITFNPCDFTNTRTEIEDRCQALIPNLDINSLFVSYDSLRKSDLGTLGMTFEKLMASSLAVKYYLCSLAKAQVQIPLLHLYEINDGDVKARESLADITVNFSAGIALPRPELFVDSPNLPNAVIHNRNTSSAHHDIILPATKNKASFNIAISCKASPTLANTGVIDIQRQISKLNINSVELLVWMYLGNDGREGIYPDDAFGNGAGCCNGLAIDMLILLKRLASHNNKK